MCGRAVGPTWPDVSPDPSRMHLARQIVRTGEELLYGLGSCVEECPPPLLCMRRRQRTGHCLNHVEVVADDPRVSNDKLAKWGSCAKEERGTY